MVVNSYLDPLIWERSDQNGRHRCSCKPCGIPSSQKDNRVIIHCMWHGSSAFYVQDY